MIVFIYIIPFIHFCLSAINNENDIYEHLQHMLTKVLLIAYNLTSISRGTAIGYLEHCQQII